MSGGGHAHGSAIQIECVIEILLCEWAEMKAGCHAYGRTLLFAGNEDAWLFWRYRRFAECGVERKAT